MDLLDIDLQRVSLGALIIALALMVDDAMTNIDAMSRRLALGDDKVAAASWAYSHLAMAMLTGTLITIAGFVPVGVVPILQAVRSVALQQIKKPAEFVHVDRKAARRPPSLRGVAEGHPARPTGSPDLVRTSGRHRVCRLPVGNPGAA